MLKLPDELTTPVLVSGQVGLKTMLDLTVYLAGPSERELDFLIDLYAKFSPLGKDTRYKIAELQYWAPIGHPDLTASGREAAAAGADRPYLAPVRKRIRDGRRFEIAFWDGRPIDDPDGSWSFSCSRIHLRSSGLHAFVRILLPLSADCEILKVIAQAISDQIDHYSGHGGLVFVYDPWLKEDAFDRIYALARRFWCVDVEDLNSTLPLMKEGIKGVSWLTLLGRRFASVAQVAEALSNLSGQADITLQERKEGVLLIAGTEPLACDQHKRNGGLDLYRQIARAVKPLLVDKHPDFPGRGFINEGNTVGWIHRFVDPDGWR